MAVTLGSNIGALRAQRRLAESSNSLSRSLERLSSGQRINRASDDAAGLAISSQLRASARVYGQALRNANDGISALSIAEGSLGELSTISTRLKELATSAANGSYSRTQRLTLDAEAYSLTKEFNRLVASTSFNGLSILSGRMNIALQVGTGTNGQLGVNLGADLSRTVGNGYSSFATVQTGTVIDAFKTAGADFNNDGIIDLAVMDGGDFPPSGPVVALGTSSGTFAAGVATTFGGDGRALTSADFNGDGKLDLVVVGGSLGSQAIEIALGNGNGTFKNPVSYGLSESGFLSVAVGDFNSDGRLDIAAGTETGNRIRILLGNGAGTFSVGATISNEAANLDLAAGDIDGDGKTDLVAVNSSGNRVRALYGSGTGQFGNGVTLTGATLPTHVKLADLNHDGLQDILVDDTVTANARFYISNTNRTAPTSGTLAVGASSNIAVDDLNGDGNYDVVAGTKYVLGNGDGTFQAPLGNLSLSSYFFTGDVNGDGAVDIVSPNGFGTEVYFATADVSTGIQRFDLTTRSGALSTIDLLDSVLNRIGKELGNLGASQSRLNSAASNIASLKDNVEGAAARISDVDIAGEAAESTRQTILQQAASSVLAQANQQPALALRLLDSR